MTFLESGEVLVHIGPPKTGTTALQQSLAAARRQMRGQGCCTPGRSSRIGPRHARRWAFRPPPIHPTRRSLPEVWERFAQRVGRRKDRAVVSSEQFADASPELVAKIVGDLGGPDRVRVLLTAPPGSDPAEQLAAVPEVRRSEAASWAVAQGQVPVVKPYEQWLQGDLGGKERNVLGRFDYPALMRRWAQVVGVERVAVIVVDSGDPPHPARRRTRHRTAAGHPAARRDQDQPLTELRGSGRGPSMVGGLGTADADAGRAVPPVDPARRCGDWWTAANPVSTSTRSARPLGRWTR